MDGSQTYPFTTPVGTREWFATKDATPYGSRQRFAMDMQEEDARSALPGRPGAQFFPWEIEEGERIAASLPTDNRKPLCLDEEWLLEKGFR